MGSTQAIKTNNIQKSDGSYITLSNSLVQSSGFIASQNITADNLNENTANQGINVTANLGITGDKKLSVNKIESVTDSTITINSGIGDTVNVNGLLSTTYDLVCGNVVRTDTIWANNESFISVADPLKANNGLSTNTIQPFSGTEIQLNADSVVVSDLLKTDFIANTTGVTGDSIFVSNPLMCTESFTVENGKNTRLTGKVFIEDIDYLARTNRQVRELVYDDVHSQIVARPYAVDNKRCMWDEFEYTQSTIIPNITLTLPSVPTSFGEIFDWLIPTNYVSDNSYGILHSNYPWRVRSNHLNSLNVATLNGVYHSGLYVYIPSSDSNGVTNFCMYRPFNCYKGDLWGGFHYTCKIACGTRTAGPMYWGLVDNSQNPFDCTADAVSTYFQNCIIFFLDTVGQSNNHIHVLHRRWDGTTQGATIYDTNVTMVEGVIHSCSINWDDDDDDIQFVIDNGTVTTTFSMDDVDPTLPSTSISYSPIVTFQRPASTLKDILIRSIKIDHFIVN